MKDKWAQENQNYNQNQWPEIVAWKIPAKMTVNYIKTTKYFSRITKTKELHKKDITQWKEYKEWIEMITFLKY